MVAKYSGQALFVAIIITLAAFNIGLLTILLLNTSLTCATLLTQNLNCLDIWAKFAVSNRPYLATSSRILGLRYVPSAPGIESIVSNLEGRAGWRKHTL